MIFCLFIKVRFRCYGNNTKIQVTIGQPITTWKYLEQLVPYTRCSMRSARSPGSMSMTGISIIV
jgi:hypothetical protein